ncbi:MAG: TatD family hydrolase [Prosthecobacter sp.]|jgi:TatD DNase family protein|nr:TatD family hydrolase [Prosthecobacter sp.]
MFFDTHTHLGSRQFDADLAPVIQRAFDAGVTRMVVPATDLENARRCLALAKEHPGIRVAVGIHPCDVDSVSGSGWIDELRELASDKKVAAIGEVGLDYYHAPPEGWETNAWRAHQAECLRLQLELAVELGLNVVLHNRDSWEDLTAIVMPYSGRLRAVFHCYTGTLEQALPLIEAGHLVSFTGIVTFKNAGQIAETVRTLPGGAYMLETDAPYLAPVPHRGRRCEPAFVADTARAVAKLRGQEVEEVASVTTSTALGFFQGF